MTDKQSYTSPTPLTSSERTRKPPAPAWEFAAIPWTFPLDEPQQIGDGWEPIGVSYVTDQNGEIGSCCLIVRRPA